MSSNLVFHRVRIGGLDFEASVLADGPALVVRGHDGRYAGWAVLGVSHLRWFESAEPAGGMAEPRGQGWHLVKYSGLAAASREMERRQPGLAVEAQRNAPHWPDETGTKRGQGGKRWPGRAAAPRRFTHLRSFKSSERVALPKPLASVLFNPRFASVSPVTYMNLVASRSGPTGVIIAQVSIHFAFETWK